MHSHSLTQKVIEYVRAHPGVTRGAIMVALPDGTKRSSVSSALTHMARAGVIENRGRSGLAARWFPVIIEVDFKFRKIAIELLKELKNVHHTQREEYLAQRLQELFGGQNQN